jgi:hypothetical protein
MSKTYASASTYPETAAGSATAYDVSPPAATTESTASGVGLAAKTFGSFTGADAASIDGYTARTVNAAGSTSWSGSGLGAYTPSGGADGDAGVLALDATIGGVVVATALHDYARAAAAAAGGSLVSMIDISGVSAYNFLTTGGTSGSGGEGPHTIAGLTWTVDYLGSGGPTRLEIVNGVVKVEITSGRPLIYIDQGVDLSQRPWVGYTSFENGVRTSYGPFAMHAAVGTTINGGDQAQMIAGNTSATKILMRENKTGAPSFTTLQDATVTDITTTPTRMAMHVMAGSWAPTWDQGTAALPTDGSRLGAGGDMWLESGSASSGQNRKYLYLNVFDTCDIRVSSYLLEMAP